MCGGRIAAVEPYNSIPATTTVAVLEQKRRCAEGGVFVDVGFWGGAVPGNLADIAALHAAGVFGFKCFLIDSGVAEFRPLDSAQFAAAMTETAHRRADDPPRRGSGGRERGAATSRATLRRFLRSRPHDAEDRAVGRVIATAANTGGRTPTCASSRRTPNSRSTRSGCGTATASAPTAASGCAARCGAVRCVRRGSAASESSPTAPYAGSCWSADETRRPDHEHCFLPGGLPGQTELTTNRAMFTGSGLFPLDRPRAWRASGAGHRCRRGRRLLDGQRGLAGVFRPAVARRTGSPLTATHLLYLATAAGARALGRDDEVGDLGVGKRFDAVQVRPADGTPLALGLHHAEGLDDALARTFTLVTPADIATVWIDAEPVASAVAVTAQTRLPRPSIMRKPVSLS